MRLFLMVVLTLAGCSSDAVSTDDLLRLNHIQVKGTHNSYHVAPDPFVLADWDYTHLPLDRQFEEQGVRQVELDVLWDGDGGFRVAHVPIFDEGTNCPMFADCLSLVRGWSDAHPAHHHLFILVEPKDSLKSNPIEGYYLALDAEILSMWPRERILTPDDVRGGHATLRAALETDGWPTLGETRGRVLFLMLDSSEHRDGYLELHPGLQGALLFARGEMGAPWSSVIETGDGQTIREAAKAGYLVRTAVGGADDTLAEILEKEERVVSAGAHIISTDYPAPVEGMDWWLDLPGGLPSRCNPVTAPPECSAMAIENL